MEGLLKSKGKELRLDPHSHSAWWHRDGASSSWIYKLGKAVSAEVHAVF
jgi:hypothetical protein